MAIAVATYRPIFAAFDFLEAAGIAGLIIQECCSVLYIEEAYPARGQMT